MTPLSSDDASAGARPGLGHPRRMPKTSELVARDLANAIVSENMPEGTLLPPEREMTEALGVGRTTLREALRLLETSGVLTIRSGPRGGPIVRRPSPTDLSEALTLILQFESATAGDLIYARISLEVAVARAAAGAASDTDLAELRATNDLLLEELDDEQSFLHSNREFHGVLAHASGNMVLEMFTKALLSLADGRALGVQYSRRTRAHVHRAHERIIDAVAGRDPAAAEAAMLEHMQEARDYWTRRYPEVLARRVRWIH